MHEKSIFNIMRVVLFVFLILNLNSNLFGKSSENQMYASLDFSDVGVKPVKLPKKAIVFEPFGVKPLKMYQDQVLVIPESGTPPVNDKEGEAPHDDDHGTMIMSLVADQSINAKYIPVYGDIRDRSFYENIQKIIKEHSVEYINMSMRFGVTDVSVPTISDRDTFREARSALYMLILKNPETLFVVASGNGTHSGRIQEGINVDYFPQYPVSNTPDNILSVGAINSDSIKINDFGNYKMSSFSNFGIKSVDILAPGENVRVASSEDSFSLEDGTSFSTAITFRTALKLSLECKKKILVQQVKEIILKTAYIPDLSAAMEYDLGDISILRVQQLSDKPGLFPVRSGGIIFPERIDKAVELLCLNPDMSVHDACLESRKIITGPGEKFEPEKLLAFWNKREI